jgi:hypothetical protein
MRTLTILALLSALAAPLSATPQPCPASPAWVSAPSEPDFAVDPPTICAFYQYSWQSFLYLTAPAPGGGGALNFETFPSVTDVFGQGATLKAMANRRLGAPTLFRDRRLERLRTFQVRGSEPLNEVEQAGSKGVLVDQNGNVTYYEQFLDPIATNFVRVCDLNVTACQTSAAAQSLRFPAGGLEIKVSWRPLPAGTPNADSYYTLKGVNVYNPQTGKETVTDLGLVGFHLVYTTPNHQEMVWATFEHVANAPDGPCAGATTPPAGFSGWAFNQAASTDCTRINQFTKATAPYDVTQAVRNYPYGTGSDFGVFDPATIQILNRSVLGLLPAGSVWRNYFLVGALWTKGGVLPAIAPNQTGANEAGSTFLSNATLETFTQWPNPPSGSTSGLHVNCFSCHNAATAGASPPDPPEFKLSHVFNNGNANACPYVQPDGSSQLPAACQNTQTLTVQLLSAHGKKTVQKK